MGMERKLKFLMLLPGSLLLWRARPGLGPSLSLVILSFSLAGILALLSLPRFPVQSRWADKKMVWKESPQGVLRTLLSRGQLLQERRTGLFTIPESE